MGWWQCQVAANFPETPSLRLQKSVGCWMKHGMKPFPCIFIVWFVLGAAFPSAKAAGGDTASRYEQPKLLTGTIYEANSDRKVVLYKFKRTVTRSGGTVNVVREFIYPDGRIAARERAVYEGDNLVSYDLEELQMDLRGSIIPPNVFATLRFNQDDEGEVLVDICHFA